MYSILQALRLLKFPMNKDGTDCIAFVQIFAGFILLFLVIGGGFVMISWTFSPTVLRGILFLFFLYAALVVPVNIYIIKRSSE